MNYQQAEFLLCMISVNSMRVLPVFCNEQKDMCLYIIMEVVFQHDLSRDNRATTDSSTVDNLIFCFQVLWKPLICMRYSPRVLIKRFFIGCIAPFGNFWRFGSVFLMRLTNSFNNFFLSTMITWQELIFSSNKWLEQTERLNTVWFSSFHYLLSCYSPSS